MLLVDEDRLRMLVEGLLADTLNDYNMYLFGVQKIDRLIEECKKHE